MVSQIRLPLFESGVWDVFLRLSLWYGVSDGVQNTIVSALLL